MLNYAIIINLYLTDISTERFPEKISSYTEFVDAYSKFENNLIDKSIPDITFNDSVSVIATLDNESSDSEASIYVYTY